MAEPPLWPYQCPASHAAVSAVLRRRSTNPVDVRDAALGDVDLTFAESVLDLGCGFGFMAERLAARVAPGAAIVGVDAWLENESAYLETASAAGRRASFVCLRVADRLPWSDHSLDLVVCSYSLYFFIEVLAEIPRVLSPNGLFLAITHSEDCVGGLLRSTGLTEAGPELRMLSAAFSAENGAEVLRPHFGQIRRIDYRNSLRFGPDDEEDMLTYLRFKLPLLVPGMGPGDALPEYIERHARQLLARNGEIVEEKNDAIFWCRSPLWR